VATGVGTPSAAAAGKPLKVTYNFLVDAVAAGYPFNADPPGANDWSCKPTAAHPRPVILVHGTAGNKNTNWRTYAPLLKNNGYCVFALTYGVAPGSPPVIDQLGGFTSIKGSAQAFADFVARVLRSTGARKVDLIGHSQGTFMPNWYVKFLGCAKRVKNNVSLAPLWHGTQATQGMGQFAQVFGFDEDHAPLCVACAQMSKDSALLKRMREDGVAAEGVRYTNIMTKYDELVRPYTSWPRAGHAELRRPGPPCARPRRALRDRQRPGCLRHCPEHARPQRKQPIPCLPVLPFVGPLA
jgi:triacylglycerol lipase